MATGLSMAILSCGASATVGGQESSTRVSSRRALSGQALHPGPAVQRPWQGGSQISVVPAVELEPSPPEGSGSTESVNRSPTSGNTLDLEVLQAFAAESNPGILRGRALIQAARGRAFQAGLKANPNVGIDFQQLFSNGQAEQYGVLIDQRIVRKEKLQLKRAVATQDVYRLQQELAVQQQRVRTDVHIAFVQALRAQRQIDLARELLEISRRALQVTRDLLAIDEIAKTDVMQAELEVASVELTLKQAYTRHHAAWRQLQAVTGQASLEVQPLTGDYFSVGFLAAFEEVLQELRRQSPEIATLIADIERARCEVRRQQVEPLPDVSVRGLLNWRDNGIAGNANAGLAVSLPLPIHDRNQGAICEARYHLVAAERRLDEMELALAVRLTPLYQQYASARETVDAHRDQLIPSAAETLQLIRSTYELGEASFASLLNAQRTYARLRLAHIDALEQWHVAKARIDGMLLSDSIR